MPVTQEPSPRMDVKTFIDRQPFSAFQFLVVGTCAAIAFIDGYDAQAMGYVAPALSADLQISRAALGPLLSASVFGMMFGALICGPLADRFGRKPVLLGCAVAFGLMTLLTAMATSLQTMLIFRMLAGLGMGGAMPIAIALTSEFTPRKYNATAITLMICGFSTGAAAGGFVAAGLISRFGWQSVFVVGGITPLLITAFAAAYLPESIRFLLVKRAGDTRIARYLERIASGPVPTYDIVAGVDEHASGGFTVKEIFADGRAKVTLLLWVCVFMNFMVLFFLQNWLPTVLNDAGIKVETAILITSLFQLAGTVGAVVLGRIFDRGYSFRTLAMAYFGGAVGVVLIGLLIGQAGTAVPLLVAVAIGSGFCVAGGQTGSLPLISAFYPTAIRSTGVGWVLGVGRVGAVLGPIIGGVLLGLGGEVRRVFWIIAVPALIATSAALLVGSIQDKRTARARARSVTTLEGAR